MAITRHLSFANLTSATALALVLAGGGYAVASGELAKNSVGSAQIKKSGVHSSDIKDDTVTGKDVKESSLGTVPSATQAQNAQNAQTATKALSLDKFAFVPKVTAAPGQTVLIATKGPLKVSLVCLDLGGGFVGFEVIGTTSVNGVSYSSYSGTDSDDLNVGDAVDLGTDNGSTQTSSQIDWVAVTPDGQLWKGYGIASVKFAGSSGCQAEVVSIG